ncbi:tRNA-specific adenosine deaminase TAD3-like isoform X1 [Lolium rigidum]|uniref:tRNA-specific adenosine deaminase TAD3-like isoform X1 n=1 Tax=Lolium rigidum TaxID=89674 RepID=UPI001F5DBC8E|nr:tRNA-specific adenosine deaminase TAD3-like isoform X1 [Lolium rigidum]XP_047048418.1 tRNA-specific adenosine deaminase TAD3-like isoform X1 [Lolium rigidum]XP_047048419.1 tRNA-specific adenosine deaminase TAD3-like isoform X1 [Lolium rigidum]
MVWELIEVPGNPSPPQHSTVDVVAANIVPKLANALIRQLNQVCPLENLRHVKRVRRRVGCGENSELSIILCLSTGPENCSEGFPEEVQKIVDNYHLSPFIARVASCCATSKEEWEEQCKLWPTSYHPPHDIDGVSGFKEEELPAIFDCMRTAMQLSQVGNAAIVVDPSNMQIISKATDQIQLHDTSLKANNCARVETDKSCSLPEAFEDKANALLLSSSRFCNGLDREVSCINPFGWMKQRSTEQKPLTSQDGFLWHPLRHAAVVAIENAAVRDRMLFPTSTNEPELNGDVENCSDDEPAKRLKIVTEDKEQSADPACCSDLSERNRPYLCTGFDIYLVWEPCAMCAMALVHQRFKRVFYALPNPITGALGSVYRLHGQKSLNHHYSVFRVKVPEAYSNGSSHSSEKRC